MTFTQWHREITAILGHGVIDADDYQEAILADAWATGKTPDETALEYLRQNMHDMYGEEDQ